MEEFDPSFQVHNLTYKPDKSRLLNSPNAVVFLISILHLPERFHSRLFFSLGADVKSEAE